jgi:hypothetical protein
MAVAFDSDASACTYVVSASANAGSTTLTLSLPAAGVYAIWGRTRAADSGADSLFVTVDDGAEFQWNVPISSSWQWGVVTDSLTGQRRLFELSAGIHTLRFRTREAGTALDVAAFGLRDAGVPGHVAPCYAQAGASR